MNLFRLKQNPILALGMVLILSTGLFADSFKIVKAKGLIKYRAPGTLKMAEVAEGDSLSLQGRIKMLKGAFLQLETPMGDTLTFKDKCYLKLTELVPGEKGEKTKVGVDLFHGKISCNVKKLQEGSTFEVKTPSAVAGVRGTIFSCLVREDGLTLILVQTGLVVVRPNGTIVRAAVPVSKGQRAAVTISGEIAVQTATETSGGTNAGTTGTTTTITGPSGTEETEEFTLEILDELAEEILETIQEELQQQRDEVQSDLQDQLQDGIEIQLEIKDID